MRRALILACLTVVLPTAPLTAGQEVTKILGKTVTEWRQILENDKNVKRRRVAVIALDAAGPGEKGVVDSLVHALQKDKAASIRQAAARVLGKMGVHAKRAVRALEQHLAKDPSAKVRQTAAAALGDKLLEFSKSTIPTLGNALADPDAGVRTAAALTLKQHKQNAREVMTSIVKAFADQKNDVFTRTYCAQILSTFSEDGGKVVPLFIAGLKEKDATDELKQALVDGVARFGLTASDATDVLLDIFGDSKAPILLRRSAGVSLTEIGAGSGKVWPVAQKMMDAPEQQIRSQAVRLAGRVCLKEPELVDALLKRCVDRNLQIRLAAIQELGELGSSAGQAKATLENIVRTSPRASLREAAQVALKKIAGE